MVFNPKLDWKDDESGGTPVTAAQLIRIETGIRDGDLTNQSSAASTRAGQIFEPIGLSDTTKTYVSDTIVAVGRSNFKPAPIATVAAIESMTGTIALPHAGTNLLAPEETLDYFDAAFSYGYPWLDGGDLRSMTGCTTDLALCHNPTTDFMSPVTGNVADHTPMSFQAMPVDSSSWFRQGWGDTKGVTFRQVLTRYAGKTVLIPEIKDAASSITDPRPILLDLIHEFQIEKSVIVASFALADLTIFVEAGIEVCWIASKTTMTLTAAELLAQGVRWVQLEGTSWVNDPVAGNPSDAVSDATISALVAGGVNVIMWTLGRQSEVKRYTDLGVKAVCVTSPYAAGDVTKYRRRADPFASGRQYAAPILTNGPVDAKDDTYSDDQRGVFVAGRHQSVVSGGANEQYLMQTWACPLEAPSNTRIEARFVFDQPHTNMGQGYGFVVGLPTDSAPLVATRSGYAFYIRQNGSGSTFKYVNGTSTGSLPSFTWTPLLAKPPVLSAALASGVAITALPVTAASVPNNIPAGTQLLLPTVSRGQVVTVGSDVAAGATSIPIASVTPSVGVASGATVPQTIPFQIDITAASITFKRNDNSDTPVTTTDTTYRGPFFAFYKYGGGSGNIVFSYQNVVVTPL